MTSVNKSANALPKQALTKNPAVADAKVKSAEAQKTQKTASRQDAFPKIEDAFDDESTQSSRSMPAFKKDAPLPDADPKAQSQFRDMLNNARLGNAKGVIGAGTNIVAAAKDHLADVGSAGSQVGASVSALGGGGDIVSKSRSASDGAAAIASLGDMAAAFLKDAGEPGLASKVGAFSGIVGKGAGIASNATGVAESVSSGLDGVDQLRNGDGVMDRAAGAVDAGASAAEALGNVAGLLKNFKNSKMQSLGDTVGKRAAQIQTGAERGGKLLGTATATQAAVSGFSEGVDKLANGEGVMNRAGGAVDAGASAAEALENLAGLLKSSKHPDMQRLGDTMGKRAAQIQSSANRSGNVLGAAEAAQDAIAVFSDPSASVLDKINATASVATSTASVAGDLAEFADGRGQTKTSGRLRDTAHVLNSARRGASIAGNVAAVLDSEKSNLERAGAGANVIAEAGDGIKSGAESIAARTKNETVRRRANRVATGAGNTATNTRKAAGVMGRGAGAVGAFSTLTDENASTTAKIEAGAAGGKVAAELAQEGAEFVAKRATKSGTKAIAKTAAKTILKSIPFIGIAADIAATADSAREAYATFNDPKASTGDKVMAGLHTATQAVGVIPVVGDAISLVGDLGKAAWGWFSD